jgi:hypothetical protein
LQLQLHDFLVINDNVLTGTLDPASAQPASSAALLFVLGEDQPASACHPREKLGVTRIHFQSHVGNIRPLLREFF